jgi:hypothetical protein
MMVVDHQFRHVVADVCPPLEGSPGPRPDQPQGASYSIARCSFPPRLRRSTRKSLSDLSHLPYHPICIASERIGEVAV